ncbi:MAG TPA: type I methionyl aminopeptidase [Chitinispirillaceae bacterium]|nr:type I methionyl aminopeptidase [Chitinispirillaceae bacterium]
MIERNDLCWCGSGKKYKKCHLFEDMKKDSSSLENKKRKKMIKTVEEIEGMRSAGAFNGQLMDYIRQFVKEGISTNKIDKLVYEYTLDHGHKPACLGYHGYPKSVCVSRNNVVCHGIPSEREIFEDGDIVNVDLTTIVDGFYGDSSETFLIGNVSQEVRRLVEVTAQAMIYGIDAVKPGNKLAAVAEAIEPYVKSEGFSVVRQYTGHGIGRKFHEIFTVYHHIDPDEEPIILEPGMTFTVEPMVNMGGYQVVTDRKDGWTVRTKDGSMSAQFEHTVLVTEEGREVLTRTPSQIAQNIRLEFSGKKFK